MKPILQKIRAGQKIETPVRVLFVGNSFTYFNDLPSLFAAMARSAGIPAETDAVTTGGAYLRQFASPQEEDGQRLRRKLEKEWDAVIVQEQSNHPAADPDAFFEAACRLQELITENGADMWLYQTWGYGRGHESLEKFGRDTQEMEMKLRASYEAAAEALDCGIAYAGAAMTDALEHGVDVYFGDFYHPSAAGSHVAAWTLLASLFRADPEQVPLPDDARIKAAAHRAAFGDVRTDSRYRRVFSKR